MNKKLINKKGSALVLSVVTVLIITSLSILIMGLVLTSLSIQKNNEKELIAHLELENQGYDFLNELTLEQLEELNYNDNTDEYTGTVSDDKYTLTVTFLIDFSSDPKSLYEITGWEITKNG